MNDHLHVSAEDGANTSLDRTIYNDRNYRIGIRYEYLLNFVDLKKIEMASPV